MPSSRFTAIVGLAFLLFAVGGHALRAQQEPPPGDQDEPQGEPQEPELRTWTDSTGKYRIEAAMVKFSGGKVHLRRKDGRVTAVSVGKLSRADQRFVREELARRAAREKPPKPKPSDVPVPAADWPGWRGTLRDGKSPDTGLLKQWPPGGPKRVWQADGIGKGFSTVAVTGGTIYTTGDVGGQLVIFALDMDGKPKWKVPHGPSWTKNHPGARSTPMIDGGRLYLVNGHGLVGCFDAENGRPIWGHDMVREFGGGAPNWGYAESVLILGDLAVVTPGGGNCIVALDKKSGRPVWSSQGFQAGAQYSSCYAFTYQGVPMIANGTHGGIVGVDAKSGRALWSNPFSSGNTANCPTPAFGDGYVFWANGYGKGGICLKLEVQDGRVAAREAWKTRDMVCHHGGYIIHEGYVYGNNGGGWACLELKSGRRMWNEPGVGKGSCCWADGMLYLFGERGGRAGLATCSPDGMEMRGTFSVEGEGTSWAHPVVIGGRLYLRYDTHLYCFDVRAEQE